jgi:hypothetical protein
MARGTDPSRLPVAAMPTATMEARNGPAIMLSMVSHEAGAARFGANGHPFSSGPTGLTYGWIGSALSENLGPKRRQATSLVADKFT